MTVRYDRDASAADRKRADTDMAILESSLIRV